MFFCCTASHGSGNQHLSLWYASDVPLSDLDKMDGNESNAANSTRTSKSWKKNRFIFCSSDDVSDDEHSTCTFSKNFKTGKRMTCTIGTISNYALLQFVEPFLGINESFFYVRCSRRYYPYHVAGKDLVSISYNGHAASKTWYVKSSSPSWRIRERSSYESNCVAVIKRSRRRFASGHAYENNYIQAPSFSRTPTSFHDYHNRAEKTHWSL